MLNLTRIREFFPQYDHMTDYELTQAVHAKQAPNVPFADFAAQFGGPTEEDARVVAARDYNARHPDAPIKPADIGQGSMVSDMGHAFAAGVNALASLPFWLEEKAEEALGLDWLAEKAKGTRQYFERSAEEKRQNYSADMKLAQDKEFVTEGPDGYGMGDAWTDPRAVGGMITESLPSMLGGMGIGAKIATGLTKADVSRGLAWAIGSSIGEGGVAGTQDSQNVYNTVMDMPEETLARSPEYQELLKTMSPPEARKALADNIAWETGWQTGCPREPFPLPPERCSAKCWAVKPARPCCAPSASRHWQRAWRKRRRAGLNSICSKTSCDARINPLILCKAFSTPPLLTAWPGPSWAAAWDRSAIMAAGVRGSGQGKIRRICRPMRRTALRHHPPPLPTSLNSRRELCPFPPCLLWILTKSSMKTILLMVPSFPHRAPGIFNSAFPMVIPLIC